MKRGKLFVNISLLILSGSISISCQTQNIHTHTVKSEVGKSIEFLDSIKKSHQDPILLVGLGKYLGKPDEETLVPVDLHLKGVGKLLILKDSSGLEHKSSEITIGWRTVSLSNPREISRQISRPLASFESAQRLASNLQSIGIQADVAYPKDWEVWIADGIVLPKEYTFHPVKKIVKAVVRPVLKGGSGEILLKGNIKIEAQNGMRWNGGIHSGPFQLKEDAYGTWTLIEEVPLERYLLGVVPHEIGFGSPAAAMAAQAVLARTWAIANMHRFAIDGYHLCSDTQCQVYKAPNQASETVSNAIASTAGKFLTWEGRPINAVYHASNGGVMASVDEAWSIPAVSYLQSQLDGPASWVSRFSLPFQNESDISTLLLDGDGAYGSQHSRFRWVRLITASELQNVLFSWKQPQNLPDKINTLKRGGSGRVVALKIQNSGNGKSVVLRRDEIRRILPQLPSTLFVINKLKPGLWQFSGGGFGHGVGLSQAGAIDLAKRGWDTAAILRHYYPGTFYGTLQDLPKAP